MFYIIIMDIKHFLRKQVLILSLAMSNVERETFRNTGDSLSDNIKAVQKNKQGYLSDDLLQGILSEEVIMLRARMYKVLNHVESTRKPEISTSLKGEPSDEYPVEIFMENRKTFKVFDDIKLDSETESPALIISREILPRFRLEDYCEKFYVKSLSDNDKIIELFISKYNDLNNKKVSFLLKAIEKASISPRNSDILDITGISFITNEAKGVSDFLEYTYDDIIFHKIIEFEEYYVIKFKCTEIVHGKNIFDKYSNAKVDHAYNNNLPRDNN